MRRSLYQTIHPFSFTSKLVLVLALGTSSAIAQAGFTELVPSSGFSPPVVPGVSAWGNGVALAAAALSWLADVGLTKTINNKLNALAVQINQHPLTMGGTLVVVIIQQSSAPDANGDYARSYLSSFIAGTGSTPQVTLNAYNAKSQLEPGVPDGFVTRHVYFWYPAPQ
ncbi:hypothetical protein RBB78_24795 (plasmid) [Tunturiibacter empetritectus]|uniref:hypothetical protein n=1 Tax=Tunturiibacter empetritectus TaxID=3069691 RepID=UPI003D9AEE1E